METAKSKKLSNYPIDRSFRLNSLTSSQLKILCAVTEGRSDKEVAQHLNLHIRTVKTHKYAVMRKLKIHSSINLTHLALAANLIENKYAGYLDVIPSPT